MPSLPNINQQKEKLSHLVNARLQYLKRNSHKKVSKSVFQHKLSLSNDLDNSADQALDNRHQQSSNNADTSINHNYINSITNNINSRSSNNVNNNVNNSANSSANNNANNNVNNSANNNVNNNSNNNSYLNDAPLQGHSKDKPEQYKLNLKKYKCLQNLKIQAQNQLSQQRQHEK